MPAGLQAVPRILRRRQPEAMDAFQVGSLREGQASGTYIECGHCQTAVRQLFLQFGGESNCACRQAARFQPQARIYESKQSLVERA